MSWRIEANRSAGGLAGLPPATAWLKRSGVMVEFDTEDEARAEAERLNDRTRSPNVWYRARQFPVREGT